MSEHFIIAIDQGHLRIYAERQEPEQFTPKLDPVEAMDFPLGRKSYASSDTSMAGRFPGSHGSKKGDVAEPGMSIDERLPMKNETDRRRVEEIATEIEHFLAERPEASWDFAAGPELHRAVLAELSPRSREHLRRAVSKDLVNQPVTELREQLLAAAHDEEGR